MISVLKQSFIVAIYFLVNVAYSFSLLNNTFKYSQQYNDQESQLQYLHARYYNSTLMRFIQQDTYPFLNKYTYANDNPVMNQDPNGHSSEPTALASIGLSFAGINLLVGMILFNSGRLNDETFLYRFQRMRHYEMIESGLFMAMDFASFITGALALHQDSKGLAIASLVTGTLAPCLSHYSTYLGDAEEFNLFHIHKNGTFYDNDGYDWEGYNGRGFARPANANVLPMHRETNTIYDPNGYRQDDIHRDTGTIYNLREFTREGYHQDGRPGMKITLLNRQIETNTENISTEFYDINILRHVQEFDYGEARGFWVRPPAPENARNGAQRVREEENISEIDPLLPQRS